MHLPACDGSHGAGRGCLSRRFGAVGLDKTGPLSQPAFGLGEVDCPSGLARCVGGTVEVARAFRHPSPCGNPEACNCPWDVVGVCETTCVALGAEVSIDGPRAIRQLCAPSGATLAFVRPPLASDRVLPPPAGACDGDPFVCVGGAVVSCEPSAHVVGVCVQGCADEVSLTSDGLSDSQAVVLLCRR